MDTPNLLRLTKKQRKSLYKYWWDNYTYYRGSNAKTENPNKYNLWETTQDWQAMNFISQDKINVFIEKYRPKFVIWAQKRVKANGGWPKEQNRTKVIKEFLARGFLHTSDVEPFPNKYPVVTLIGELQWPVYFDQHDEALEVSKKFGITGYTKCPIPK